MLSDLRKVIKSKFQEITGDCTLWNWTTAIYLVVSIIISVASYLINRSIAQQQAAKQKRQMLKSAGYLANIREGQAPIMVVYGKHKVGCNQVYIEVKSEYTLCFVAALCEGPIYGIEYDNDGKPKIYFGEHQIHNYPGFDDELNPGWDPEGDDIRNWNLALGTGNQDDLPVYTWSNLISDPMRWTAYLQFRIHWHAQDDYSDLGGFPTVTAFIYGKTDILDPRILTGQEGIQGQLRGHDWNAPVGGGSVSFSLAADGLFCVVVGTLASGHWFRTFPKWFLMDGPKKVQIRWKQTQANEGDPPTVVNAVHAYVMDGPFDRADASQFPSGNGGPVDPLPLGTVVQDLADITSGGADSGWITTAEIPFDLATAWLEDVTLFITVADGSSSRAYGFGVDWVKILDADGNVVCWDQYSDPEDTLTIEDATPGKEEGLVGTDAPCIYGNLVYTDNPALVILDIMINERFGMGVPVAWFDMDSVEAAAAWCDSQNYHFNGALWEQDYGWDTVQLIAETFRMKVIFVGGYFTFLCMVDEVACLSFVEDDIKADSFRIQKASAQDVPTAICMKYVSSKDYYAIGDYILPSPAFIAAEGEYRVKEIATLGLTSYNTAKKLAIYQLERAYYCDLYIFQTGMKGYPLEPGDVIDCVHSVPGWVTPQKLRIVDMEYMPQGECSLVCLLEFPSLYDETLNTSDDEDTYVSGGLEGEYTPSKQVTLIVVTASENLTAGNLINIWNDAGTIKGRKADASVFSDHKEANGFVKQAAALGELVTVYLPGQVDENLAGMTLGAQQWLSEVTPGGVTETAPSGSGEMVQLVGRAQSATSMIFQPGTPYGLV